MLATILHRGPDDGGVWLGGQVGLGHRRLAILDLSPTGHQPMSTADGAGVLAYNGEIYNYRSLRSDLETAGIGFTGTSDAEVLLQALHAWGPERTIPLLNGMFAFAYLDRRNNSLWLARDRLGIKHLYVADTGRELIFASEVKALLAHPGFLAKIDRAALRKRFMSKPRAQDTLFEGISGLEAGSWWKIDTSGRRKHRYFDVEGSLDVDRLIEAQRQSDPSVAVTAFREAFGDSVRLHLASDAPLAAMCSGGVDSSLIAAFAHDDVQDLVGYVADAPVGAGEGDQAERAGNHIGIRMRRIKVSQEEYLRLWPHAVRHLDGPAYNQSEPALLAVAKACRADGIKVLLTGEGADELFGGYSWHAQTYQRWLMRDRLERFLPMLVSKRSRRRALDFPLSELSEAGFHRQWQRALALDTSEELAPRRLFDRLAGIAKRPERAFLVHGLSDMLTHLPWLLHRHDHLGMAASIEMRVPFLENRLIDFAMHLPVSAKYRAGQGKWLEKAVALERLPRDIVLAKKKGFPMPKSYTRGTERLLVGGALAEQLEWSASTTRDVVAALSELNDLRYMTVGMEIFLQQHLGQQSAEEVGERLVSLSAG